MFFLKYLVLTILFFVVSAMKSTIESPIVLNNSIILKKFTNVCIEVHHKFQQDNKPFYPMYSHNDKSINWGNISSVSHLKKHMIKGRVLMPNCFYQGTNPAHYLFGLSIIYDFVTFPDDYPQITTNNFDRLGLFYCSSPKDNPKWHWSKDILDIVMNKSSNLFGDNANNPLLLPDRHRTSLYCFEEMIQVWRWGYLLSNKKNIKAFQHDFKLNLLNSSKSKVNSNLENIQIPPLLGNIKTRCKRKNLQIVIQNRQENRHIHQISTMIKLIHEYTPSVYQMMITPNTPTSMQYKLYNSFDILITVAGSHLSNMIFIEQKNVAIIELGIAIRDKFWNTSARELVGINYFYGHHHLPIKGNRCSNESLHTLNSCISNPIDNSSIICPDQATSWKITECDININWMHFRNQLTKAIESLCDNYQSNLENTLKL